ncbi:Na+/H+ antiporter NhaC family protein [Fusibacter sp. 3D3]|uniref:Na+/H+ antiporter NhaC family protein n=1 Tax=Fusibacter sp. 3D3 TaxID=1048380 RepID=UPI000853A202|nr:Na+/H+ antiporter NhaC family protein [Fusibacter sp. 3D3]GAU76654.1 Na+/H+ antiporter [Fusibacter sp. 3D3]
METNYGILSLLPILLTIGLAIKTRKVIVSLLAGVFTGVLILVGGNPMTAVTTLLKDFVLAQLLDSYNAGVILLLVFIGGFVTLVEKSGAAETLNRSVAKIINNRHKTQIAAWIGGIIVFFSDLGTPLIVGPVFTPLFKKMRISKEKLAWILDTTASPVCILIPFIGWGVYSMGLIQTELDALNITHITDFNAFVSAIPFQFYAILSLLLVPIVAISGREFSAMAKAEQRAMQGVFSTLEDGVEERQEMILNNDASPLLLLIPLLVLFVTLFGLLIPQGFPFTPVPGSAFRISLMTGYLFGAISLILLMKFFKLKSLSDGISMYISGCGKLFDVIMMLVLAWSLSSAGKLLGTSSYIVQLAQDNIPAWSIPAIIFLIAALISFSTGTSWGTFAIMMPIAIPMAIALGAPLYVTIAAVLSGGLFGDHCSPVSDTTILSATGATCGLIDHVKTQLPYALITGSISLMGFVIAGIYESVIVTLLCILMLIAVYYALSKTKIGTKIANLTIEEIENLERLESAK